MKALLASALTALVLVTTAWASNVTPGQLAALSKRVTKLEHTNAALTARLAADEAAATKATATLACVQQGWNAQHFVPYLEFGTNGWPTTSGNLTVLATPSATDGLVGVGYLIDVDTELPQC